MSPSEFATTKLDVVSWSKMDEIFEAVQSGHRKILVRSCNGAGKTTALAALCNWKLSEFEDSIVLTTASSWTQVTRTLWGEIRRQVRYADLFSESDMSSTNIKLDDKHYAIGISPSIPENAQGFHAPNMLIVVDEATGVDREIITALWGNATSADSQMVLIYNPIDTSSYPFDAEESGQWHVITISAFEHPNVELGVEVIPGAVTRQWVEDRLSAWSYEVDKADVMFRRDPEHPDREVLPQDIVFVPWLKKYYKKTSLVSTRICGEWPIEGGEGFIDLALVRRSYEVESIPGEYVLGVDIARAGDDRTVFARFCGNTLLGLDTVYGRDLMYTANRIKEYYELGYTTIGLDDTGIGGGVSDRLRELQISHHAINFAHAAKNMIPFKDVSKARSEMYFVVEEELRRGELRLLQDRELEQELTGYRLDVDPASGSYRLEPKDELKKRICRSPDKSDAVALARYAARLQKFRSDFLF